MSVTVVPAIAVRLSGLSAHSAGNGRFSRTVVHYRAAGPIEAGRFRRREWEFLCRTGFPWDVSDRPGEAVTCEDCAKKAARLGLAGA